MYQTVGQLLQTKGQVVWSVEPATTVYEALVLMAEKNIGAVIVLDDAGKVAGIFSERDYARKVVLKGRDSRSSKVGDLMTREVLCITPEESLENCLTLMTSKRARHLPVLSGGELIGLISIGDVVKMIIDDREFTIDQLQRYITGP
jgi:CBS domain-containing protein